MAEFCPKCGTMLEYRYVVIGMIVKKICPNCVKPA